MRVRGFSTITLLVISLGFTSAILAQRTGTGGGRTPDKPANTSEPKQKTNATVTVVKYVNKPVTPTTGRLFVVAETGAVILIEPLNIRTKAQKGIVPEGERGFVFNDLVPGNYRVAATLSGYHETEKTPVLIKRNESRTITLDFEPVLHTVKINTNVDSGELKYWQEDETPRVQPIQGKTSLQLQAGDYEAELNAPEGMGYKPRRQKFSVKGDMDLEFALERIRVSTEPLRPNWNAVELEGWEVPTGWHADAKKLVINSSGVALPRDENKRYYKDFQLSSNITKFNGAEIGFALRARDKNNYYLLEFTGEKSDEPYTMRLFIVKNGTPKRIGGIEIVGEPKNSIKAGQFSVVVTMIDNRIEVKVEDNSTGASNSLGALIDPDRTYTIGAVGIASRSSNESAIWQFHVCSDCLKPR